LKKGLTAVADGEGKVGLEALRKFKDESMAIILMEERCNIEFEAIQVEGIYSPRTWRSKISANPPGPAAPKKRAQTSMRAGAKGKDSGQAAASPRAKGKKTTGVKKK